MTFKAYGLEFFQEEFDALAAEVGKLAHEIEFAFRDEVQDGVEGRVLHVVAPPAAPDVVEITTAPEIPTSESPATQE